LAVSGLERRLPDQRQLQREPREKSVDRASSPHRTGNGYEAERAGQATVAKEHLTIIRWTTKKSRRLPVHYGILRYGADASALSEIAKSRIRLNPQRSSTIFRVRLDNLKPHTAYSYRIDSTEANDELDHVVGSARHRSIR